MKLLLNTNSNWAIVPEGNNVKLKIESAKAVPSGKPSSIEVVFKHENGGTIKSTYDFKKEMSMTIFSILVKHTLGSMTEFDTADLPKLVGKAVLCEIVHNKVPSTKDPSKELSFANIKRINSGVTTDDDVYDTIPFDEEDDI